MNKWFSENGSIFNQEKTRANSFTFFYVEEEDDWKKHRFSLGAKIRIGILITIRNEINYCSASIYEQRSFILTQSIKRVSIVISNSNPPDPPKEFDPNDLGVAYYTFLEDLNVGGKKFDFFLDRQAIAIDNDISFSYIGSIFLQNGCAMI